MLLVAGALAGLLAGLAGRGSLRHLARLRLRLPWVVLVALLVRELGLLPSLAQSALVPALFTASLAALLAWTLWHVDQLPALGVVAAGMALNLVVAAANGGRIPVAAALAGTGVGAQELLHGGHYGPYILAGGTSRLDRLGDWIALPGPLGRVLPFAYSPGDLVAFLGMVLSGFQAVRSGPAREA